MLSFLQRASRGGLFLVCAIGSLMGGCVHSVTIIEPLDGIYPNPQPRLTVKFDSDFKPGTFEATLSGVTITNLFYPTPVAGGTSQAYISYPPNFLDGEYDNNRQHLVVDAEFNTPTIGLGSHMTRDSSTFTPPPIRIYRGPATFDPRLYVQERETISATVWVERAPTERLPVTITGHALVSLNNMPAGQPIQVVIMPNDRRADFTIRGIQVSGEVFRIRPIATGYGSMSSAGLVQRDE